MAERVKITEARAAGRERVDERGSGTAEDLVTRAILLHHDDDVIGCRQGAGDRCGAREIDRSGGNFTDDHTPLRQQNAEAMSGGGLGAIAESSDTRENLASVAIGADRVDW